MQLFLKVQLPVNIFRKKQRITFFAVVSGVISTNVVTSLHHHGILRGPGGSSLVLKVVRTLHSNATCDIMLSENAPAA